MSYHFWNFWRPNLIFGTRRDEDIVGTDRWDWIFAGRGDDETDNRRGNPLAKNAVEPKHNPGISTFKSSG